MPFIGDTFGLNSVYEKQVLNIENRNLLNWPEYPTYGYFVGGTSLNAPAQSSTITRLDLATNVGSLPGNNIPAARSDLVSVSNNFYGYFSGGVTNTTIRLDFSNETTSLPGKDFPQANRANQATVSNSLYGYFGGGYSPSFSSIISRLEFSSETISNPGKNFAPSRARFAAASSSTYGYFGGGYTPTLRSTITRLDFTNETLVDPGKNLPTGIGDHSALSNISYGYFAGGTGFCNINRLDFSNETVSAPGKNLPSIRRGPLVFSSSTATGSLNGSYGYFGGGGVPTGSGLTDIIQRIDFGTENIDTLSAVLGQQVRQGAAVANAGSSFRRNSKTYGYFAGGRNSTNPAQNYSTIDRVDFSNETVSNPGKNFSSVRYSMDAMSNNFYGYFGGGYGSGAPAISTITRLDFSNETLSDPGKNLPTARTGPIATSSSSYGYFGGGYDPTSSFPKEINTITRLDFSNETVSDPGKNLLRKNRTMATSSNNFYGYFLGGLEIPGGLVTTLNTITRLDFSNETISNPGKNLPSERRESASLSSSSYGYFGGGYTPPATVLNTITRFDFSNETVSNPGKNLPAVRIRFAATSSNFYGYFGGGWDNFAFSNVTRLDFSNETVSASGQNLTISRGILSAVSNSN